MQQTAAANVHGVAAQTWKLVWLPACRMYAMRKLIYCTRRAAGDKGGAREDVLRH